MAQNLPQPILSSMPRSVSDLSHLASTLFQSHDTGALSPSHTGPTAGIEEQTKPHFQTVRTAAEETQRVVTFHHSMAPARAVLAGCSSRQDLLRKEPVH